MTPKLPAQKLPCTGCGAGEGPGRGTPRPGAGKPQSCSHHPAQQAACRERPPWGRVDGAHPSGKVTARSPEGPSVPKVSSSDGRGVRGPAKWQALFRVPSLGNSLRPRSHSPARKPVATSTLTEEAEARGGEATCPQSPGSGRQSQGWGSGSWHPLSSSWCCLKTILL